jgi:NADH-quinone oxidoreductase subunit L
MILPLGALAIGAVLAGMVWHKQFFGEHERMAAFFAMGHGGEHAESADAEGATTDAAQGGEPAAESAGSAAGESHTADAAAPAESAGAAEPAGEGDAPAEGDGTAPQGAIYMSADSEAVLDAAHHAPKWVKVSPFVAMLVGFFTAWMFYIRRPDLPGKWAATNPVLYRLLLNKWYFDEVYDFFFVAPAKWLGGFLWQKGDGAVIDGSINGVAMGIVPFFTRLAGRAQSGYVFTYALFMVLGIALLLTWMTLSGGAE